MCWCSVPPRATLSACAPRQMPSSGIPRASAARASSSSKRSSAGSVGPSRLVGAAPYAAGSRSGPPDRQTPSSRVEQRRHRAGLERRQHDGHAAGQLDRAHVGQPERHLVLRRLAVTAQRREVAAPHLGGGDADQRSHRGNVGQRAPILNRRCPANTSSRCTSCPGRTRRTSRSSRTSRCPSCRARRSASSATTAPGKSTLLRIMAGQGHRVPRRGAARARRDRRAARAGAPARREQGRARQRRGRRRRDARAARPLQRARRQLLRRDRRRVRARPGADRRRRRLEPRHPARHRDGRAAPAARRRRRDQALRRRAPPRRALPAAARARPTCCCSTSRPTTSTPSRSAGSSATSRSTRAPSWP